MTIEKQFNQIAREYDANRRKFIPCFDGYYEHTTRFIAANIAEPRRVLDLGAGTGLLTSYWYQQYPDADYVLVDVAEEMLEVARMRFAGVSGISYRTADYSKGLPEGEFGMIVSALSIHHLERADKQELFARIYAKLPDGGVFVNYDQFCAGQERMNRWYDSYWEAQLTSSGLTEHDIETWRERRKLDRECSVPEEIALLSAHPFETVQCVYSCQKFAVIAAVK